MAGIEWMNEDFSKRVRDYLTPDQLVVWDEYVEARDAAAEKPEGTAGTSRQVQEIRVTRNPFSAEYGGSESSAGSFGYSSGSGVQAEIISRGGTGAWHGNFQFEIKDDALDARNPFASNKPDYQQRDISVDVSGPLIPNRLTIGGFFYQSVQDTAETVNALTLDGPVQFGFTRPSSFRYGGTSGTLQLTEKQSMRFSYYRRRSSNEKRGMGGLTLPERAYDYTYAGYNINLRHIWFASEHLVQDITFYMSPSYSESMPAAFGRSINVLGAFYGGGSQNLGRSENRSFSLSPLWIYSRGRWVIRAGGELQRSSINERSESGFQGTFTFPDLDSYSESRPILYKEIRGNPVLENSQTEWALFFQNEFEATSRITLFFGFRYQNQANLDDNDNIDPRVAVAFALDKTTVLRAGFGIFSEIVPRSYEDRLLRLDGTRQYEIVVENPSFPDPFLTGEGEIVPPSSRRVRAADLRAPYSINSSIQVERSLPKNLFVTASFNYEKRLHVLRSRNLNAPLPGETERPDPSEGNVWLLESTGIAKFKAFRASMRQRFSIFSLSASYSYEINGGIISGFGAPTDNFNLRADYAEYSRHRINTSINSRLWWELYLTTYVSYNNGSPYTITTGYDDNGDGVTNDRPEGVPRYSMRGPHQTNVRFYLTKAFSLGTWGNGGISPKVNLFANLDNAFNRTNYGTPIGILSSPFFGQSISAYSPREITMGMRFQF